MVRSMREVRQSRRRSARPSTRVEMRWKIKELITIRVSSILKMPLLNSLTTEAKLIQVTRTATKYANVNFLTWIWSIFLHNSFGVEGWLVIGWVVDFGWFE